MALAVLTVTLNSGCASNLPWDRTESTPLASLCVLDHIANCWIDEATGSKRDIQEGDYVLSPEDMNRILEKLKSVQQ